MQRLLLSLNDFFGTLPRTMRPWRWLILSTTLAISVVMAIGAFRVTVDQTYDSWFDSDDPALIALDRFRAQFGSDDGVFLVYRAKDGNVFSYESLSAIRSLHERLEAESFNDESSLSHITRIQGLSNARVQLNEGDTLRSVRLVPHPLRNDPAELAAIEATARAQTGFPLFYFSENGEYGALMIQTDFGAIPIEGSGSGLDDTLGFDGFSGDFSDGAFNFDAFTVDESAQSIERQFRDTDFYEYIDFMVDLRGVIMDPEFTERFEYFPIGNAAMMDLTADTMVQMGMLFLLMIVIVVALLWLLLHSASAVVWPVLAISLCTLWVVGFCGWFDIALSQMLGLTATLILAVGVADCVHVMSTYLYYRRHDLDHESALDKAYLKTGLPILLTTLTTMAGMLALATNPLVQFRVFGFASAAGVFLALLFTVIVLPVLMDLWHPKDVHAKAAPKSLKPQRWYGWLLLPFRLFTWPIRRFLAIPQVRHVVRAHWLQPTLEAIPDLVARAPRTIAAVFLSAFVLFLYGTSQAKLDSNIVELFKEGTSFRVAYEVVDEHMMGTGGLSIMMDFQRSDALQDPQVLHAIDRLQGTLEAKYSDYVVRTSALTDVVKDTLEVMTFTGNRNIPNDSMAVSQLLYMFNSANPEDRRALVSDDYSRSHISVQMLNAGSYEYGLFFHEMQDDIDAAFEHLRAVYPDMDITVTGTTALMMRLADDLARTQFQSLLLAIFVISLLLMISLGSLQAGLLGMVPNLLPAIFAFGFLGLIGSALDADTLLIAPLIIGIAVDDTIHFLTHYRIALARTKNMMRALRDTIKEVGQAVTFTTLILGLGFMTLGFSDYLGIAKVGWLGGGALFIALLCDLLLLPALIMIFKPRFGLQDVETGFSTPAKAATYGSAT